LVHLTLRLIIEEALDGGASGSPGRERNEGEPAELRERQLLVVDADGDLSVWPAVADEATST
jgi:hypothetical protein